MGLQGWLEACMQGEVWIVVEVVKAMKEHTGDPLGAPPGG